MADKYALIAVCAKLHSASDVMNNKSVYSMVCRDEC